ncbi:MAG: hypothetical protein CVV34_01250, partial [Methanomicrobiales archaeon HGW-Methanomicrobiales-5]
MLVFRNISTDFFKIRKSDATKFWPALSKKKTGRSCLRVPENIFYKKSDLAFKKKSWLAKKNKKIKNFPVRPGIIQSRPLLYRCLSFYPPIITRFPLP